MAILEGQALRLLGILVLATALLVGGIFLGAFAEVILGGSGKLRLRSPQPTAPLPMPDPEDLKIASATVELLAPRIASPADFDQIVVGLDAFGRIDLFGDPVSLQQLEQDLRLESEMRRDEIIVAIRPHDDCDFRHIERVMSVCERCAIRTYYVDAPSLGADAATVRTGPGET